MTDADRFWSKVDKRGPDECWPWLGTKNAGGYGQFYLEGRHVAAHRFSYIEANGPIPAGLVMDHLCRNRVCVNPAHLEAVTEQVNIAMRGESPSSKAYRADTCVLGHPFTPENTFIGAKGERRCNICRRRNSRVAMLRERARLVARRAEPHPFRVNLPGDRECLDCRLNPDRPVHRGGAS